MGERLTDGLRMTVRNTVAEGDQVALEVVSHGVLKNGRVYDNEYHLLMRLRGGKIAAVREYVRLLPSCGTPGTERSERMAEVFMIGELASRTARSRHAIRWYETQGLMPGVQRNGSGRRVYNERHVDWLAADGALAPHRHVDRRDAPLHRAGAAGQGHARRQARHAGRRTGPACWPPSTSGARRSRCSTASSTSTASGWPAATGLRPSRAHACRRQR